MNQNTIEQENPINPETKKLLIKLAQKYETASFTEQDPSQFIRWYSLPEDVEVASFIAAMLSFGNRKQFIPKIRYIFELADKAGGMAAWLKNGQYKKDFECSDCKFYRFYSYSDMLELFSALERILQEYNTLGNAVKAFCRGGLDCAGIIGDKGDSCINDEKKSVSSGARNSVDAILPCSVLDSTLDFFRIHFSKASIVPRGKTSANKRIFMFLRWMVRQNSPVDLGLWSWFPSSQLIIPLDVHVLQEAKKLNLIPQKAPASLNTAHLITAQLQQIWPEDPCKGDFALFGLGVDEEK